MLPNQPTDPYVLRLRSSLGAVVSLEFKCFHRISTVHQWC